MPNSGMRKLTVRESLQRCRAITCPEECRPVQCNGQVYVNLFFDGTGNNKDWKEPGLNGTQTSVGKHSNVARLYNASIDRFEDGFFSHYVPGLGTPFEKIGDPGGHKGMAGGYMGADRINWAITRILNSVHYYLTEALLLDDETARTVVNNASSLFANMGLEGPYRRMVLTAWEQKLEAIIRSSQRQVTRINVAVFGFSRGAAIARVFANWLLQLMEQKDGAYRLASVPIRFYFMGLFDTVASVGVPDIVPGFNGHLDWAEGYMDISPAVDQCVHFVALHEQRASFPLELAARARQVGYPGMHSDVGGGYRPGEQGKAMPEWGASPHLSQIPLIDMHHAAFSAGVPLMTMAEIRQAPNLAVDYHCSPRLVSAANDFFKTCGIDTTATGKAGVTGVLKSHTLQYLQWRGELMAYKDPLKTRRFYLDAKLGADRARLQEGVDDFAEHITALRRRLQHAGSSQTDLVGTLNPIGAAVLRVLQDDVTEPVDAETRHMLEHATHSLAVPPAVRTLMDDYVHDSRCGFRMGGLMEPRRVTNGYFRYRQVY